MNKVLIRLLLESPLGALIYKALNYLDERKEKDARRRLALSKARPTEVQEKSLLHEGILQIKRKIKDLYGSEAYNSGILGELDITRFATGKNAKLAKVMHDAYVYTGGKDVKTELDREKMIYKRIGHYEDLQKDKLKRDLIRRIRHEQDPQIKAKLELEFKEKYL
jgi:hypothetical protein